MVLIIFFHRKKQVHKKKEKNMELKDGVSTYYKPVNPNGRKMR